MEVLHERCAGLDVHKKSVSGCVLVPEGREKRSFGTTTRQLRELADWLEGYGVSQVAMESTGVYWKPVYNLLEERGFQILLVNAKHIKAVPGRKTDLSDAEWIAQLLRHGLLRGSYVPSRPERELRELVRHRRTLIRQRAETVNRIQKVLEGANIKLASVASDVLGASGRAMLEAMVAGEEDPAQLASLARGTLKGKRAELEEALEGSLRPHQRLLLASLLRQVEFLDREIAGLDEEVARRMRPFEPALEQLDTIPGIGRRLAEEIVAETGTDMSRFPTEAHLASWAKVCPGNHESAGKRLSGRTGKGNPWLRTALVEAAWAAARTKGTF